MAYTDKPHQWKETEITVELILLEYKKMIREVNLLGVGVRK